LEFGESAILEPQSAMSAPAKAVFLSYASQDAEAAWRICEALRAAGVAVWFDRSELRGGDAWDQKVRRQIKECALFVPVVSATTQSRHEGYFRLEWRLADQRTHLMGKSRPFLVPVCIDDTGDTNADVPDSFLAVHWTRLPAGETPAAFCERITELAGRAKKGRTGSFARTAPSGCPMSDSSKAVFLRYARAPRAVWSFGFGVLSSGVPRTAIRNPR
jgi:hypothetical protein